MQKLKIILTGATGMVGEGVLLHCLQSEMVEKVLVIGRRPLTWQNNKLTELLLPDFNKLEEVSDQLTGYDACFYCAGVSSVGMSEADYTRITYDTTLNFAKALFKVQPAMVFNFVTGAHTNLAGRQMWQRVKGKTENDLIAIGFKGQYNFRPGFMKPVKGQKNIKWFFKPLIALFPLLLPKQSLRLEEVGQAMIQTISTGYPKAILEIKDIKQLAEMSL